MATVDGVFDREKDLEKIFVNGLEAEIKDRLCWQNSRWEQAGEQKKFRKLINSLKYWVKQLEKAQNKNNVILTVYNEDRDVRLTLEEVFDAIAELDSNIQIKGHATFRNPRYLSITFESEKVRDFIRNNLKTIAGNDVVFLDWASQGSGHYIKIQWLSDETDIKYSREFLNVYFDIIEESREIHTLLNGKTSPTGTVSFKGLLKEGKNIDLIPHLATIQGLECLITISGRKIMCLTCEQLGHKASACPTPYCGQCKSLKEKNHTCRSKKNSIPSYADKVSGKKISQDTIEQKDLNADVIIEKKKTTENLVQLVFQDNQEKGKTKSMDNEQSDILNKKKLDELSLKDNKEKEDSEDSEPDFSESGGFLTKMENCLAELGNLNASIIKDSTILKDKEWDLSSDGENMNTTVNQSGLKRKSTTSPEGWLGNQTLGANTRNYGRRGSSAKVKYEKKMEKIKDQFG